MPTSKTIILGIDPGLADTGWGVIVCDRRELKMLACGSIKTNKKNPTDERLATLAKELNVIIKKYQPDRAAIEKIFFFKNQKTIINVSEGRGVALLTLSQHNLPIDEYTPLQIKQTLTGYGAAEKKQVGTLVKLLLNLKEIPKPDDAADSLACAITAARFHNLN
jgi:crossover junction endodeoxyribonuclease RuvC